MQKNALLPALPSLEHCRQLLKQHDKERYLISLYLPSPLRECSWVLGAFNVEVARTASAVSEEMIGVIRLKWWGEVLEMIQRGEKPREHPVVEAIDSLYNFYQLPLYPLERMIEQREIDLGQGMLLANIAQLDKYASITGAAPWLPLSILAGEKEAEVTDYLTRLGHLWTLTGLLRSTGFHLHENKTFIPTEVFKSHDFTDIKLETLPEKEVLLHTVVTKK